MFEQSRVQEELHVQVAPPWRRVAIGVIGMFVVAIVSALLGLQSYFAGMIMPGVKVGDIALGGKTLNEGRLILNQAAAADHLSFVVAGKRYSPSTSQVGVHYLTEKTLTLAYQQGRQGFIPHPVSTDVALSPVVNEAKLSAYLAPILALGTAPTDASLEVRRGVIQIVPDQAGWAIDKSVLVAELKHSLMTFRPSEPVLEPTVLKAQINVQDLHSAQAQAAALMSTPVTLTDGTKVIAVSGADIGGWISFTPNAATGQVEAMVDPAKVESYVANLARRLDVSPVKKEITIADGVTSIQSEGSDGNSIVRQPLVTGLSVLKANQPVSLTIARQVVPFQTVTTTVYGIGSGKYIEVNLSKQHLWVWDNHAVIYDSPLTSGATGANLATVVGTFHIYYKTTNTHLVGPGYDVPVQYWMPFYLGYGLHDASWRNGNFGGSDYYYGGSHGCVNLPLATAAFIYNWSQVGTPVYVHN